jgi:transposase
MKTHHFDINVDPSDNTMEEMQAASRPQCVEVITGLERRREWLARDKASIIAESLAEGAVVSDVARRHGLRPQQLFNWRSQWRKAAKDQVLSPPAARAFVPAILEDEPPSAVASPAAAALTTADGGKPAPIEIALGEIIVRVRGEADLRALTMVLKALGVRT